MPASIPITQLIIDLISSVGVANFILVVVVLAVIINAPTIVNQITRAISGNKKVVETQQTLGRIDKLLTDTESSNKSISKEIQGLKYSCSSISKIEQLIGNSREASHVEISLVAENLAKLLLAISSMEKMMRNVISEEDINKIASSVLGISISLKLDLLKRTLDTIEALKDVKTGQMTHDLRSDMNSAWSDFKTFITSFNSPVNLKQFFNKCDKKLWSENGLFTYLLNSAASDADMKIKRDTISKQIDTGLRNMQADLVAFLDSNKYDIEA